jgi:hypothetical protein
MALYRDMPVKGVVSCASGVTEVTKGTAGGYSTKLEVDTSFPAIAGGAALAVGKQLFTFPAGRIVVHATGYSLALQQTEDNVTADTPDMGIGTTIGSGAVAVLGGTAGFENMVTGQTMDDCDGTVETVLLGTQLIIEAADSHAVYLNVADTWAASGDAALGVSGDVVIHWALLD